MKKTYFYALKYTVLIEKSEDNVIGLQMYNFYVLILLTLMQIFPQRVLLIALNTFFFSETKNIFLTK